MDIMNKKTVATAILLVFSGLVQAKNASIEVWKSPTCGCCTKWVSHLEKNGFEVIAHNTNKMTSIKDGFNIPKGLRSCHTAKIGDVVIEGHVPASDIMTLLESDKKNISIIGVPGMPAGSPGMEMGDRFQPFPVVSINKNGEAKIFSYHKNIEK